MSTRIVIPLVEPTYTHAGPAILASGHRPFFLLAGLSAMLLVPVWLAAWAGQLPLSSGWHGHEMIFAFAGAAIGGFLMAAVPKWTNGTPVLGKRLLLLIGLWLAGRVGMLVPGLAWLDLAYLPVLAAFIGADIWRARNSRNYQVPAMLLVLSLLNLGWHLEFEPALRGGVYLVAALIALIGGRIVPAFTQSGLRMAGQRNVVCDTPAWLDAVAVPAVLAVVISEALAPWSVLSGGTALLAGLVLLARMWRWHSLATGRVPLVWILHVGYVWVPVGFLLKAGFDLGGWGDPLAALHALTAGAIATMILAVGSRAALGHSGRPLVPSRWTVLSYVLVTAAAAVRVFGWGEAAVMAAGGLWTAGWAVFCVVYWPILTRPRLDGLPG
jgi:uncharacterized protein involved in response to NO